VVLVFIVDGGQDRERNRSTMWSPLCSAGAAWLLSSLYGQHGHSGCSEDDAISMPRSFCAKSCLLGLTFPVEERHGPNGPYPFDAPPLTCNLSSLSPLSASAQPWRPWTEKKLGYRILHASRERHSARARVVMLAVTEAEIPMEHEPCE